MPSLPLPTDGAFPAWLRDTVFAHRGLHSADRVENSPSAFAAAIERGLGIECDIRQSADGRAMVFHDAVLDRLTDQSGAVDARTVAQLTAIRLGQSEDRIPTLRDLLDMVGGEVPLLLEIKSDRQRSMSPLCLSVRAELDGYGGPVAVMSFDPRVPAWFARREPQILRGLVVTEETDRGALGTAKRELALLQSRAQFVACDIRDLPSRFAARAQKRGLPLLTWTVRDRTQFATARACRAAPIAEGAVLEIHATAS